MASISSRNSNRSTQNSKKYVHELRYNTRMELCGLLDLRDRWKDLGGFFNLTDVELNNCSKALHWTNGSPTEQLLAWLDDKNVTIVHLFKVLGQLKHFRAMEVLKSHVPPKYHVLIQQDTLNTASILPEAGDQGFGVANREIGRSPVQNHELGSIGQRTTERRLTELDADVDRRLPRIPFEDLLQITNFWDDSRKLGQGGFASVYRATWKNTEVAIKRPSPRAVNRGTNSSLLSLKELKYMADHKHPNILPLFAYSLEHQTCILIFEYMCNRSLEFKLHHSPQNTTPLLWFHRFNIAKGTARGLQFLHQLNERKPLVHGDIKSANILLDEHLEPKIADFGLAREGDSSNTHVTISKVSGTRAYLPYEFIQSKQLSTKVDTYSFGVVLCEMATNKIPGDRTGKFVLRDIVDKHDDSKLEELMPFKPENKNWYTVYVFNLLIKLAKQCIHLDRNRRPEMTEVFHELEKHSDYISQISPSAYINYQLSFDRRGSSPTNLNHVQLLQPKQPIPEIDPGVGPSPSAVDSSPPKVTGSSSPVVRSDQPPDIKVLAPTEQLPTQDSESAYSTSSGSDQSSRSPDLQRNVENEENGQGPSDPVLCTPNLSRNASTSEQSPPNQPDGGNELPHQLPCIPELSNSDVASGCTSSEEKSFVIPNLPIFNEE